MTRARTSTSNHQKRGHARKLVNAATKPTRKARATHVYRIKYYTDDGAGKKYKELKVPVTETFDRLWYYMSERKLMYDKRLKGLPQPWTKDEVLKSRSFCNTFRLTDKTCQYLIEHVIKTGSQEPSELVFRVVLFDIFTRVSTWECILQEISSPPTWADYNRHNYATVLQGAHDVSSIYSGAFQKPAPVAHGFKSNLQNHLVMLEELMESGLPDVLVKATRICDVYHWIRKFPGFGDFNTWQLLQNLVYTGLLAQCSDLHSFVVLGCGAKKGLQRCLATSLDPVSQIVFVRWMKSTQRQHFRRLGYVPATLGLEKHEVQLVDIEHALCEVEKYERIGHTKKTFKLSDTHASQFILPINFSTTKEVEEEVEEVEMEVEDICEDDVEEVEEEVMRDDEDDDEVEVGDIYYVISRVIGQRENHGILEYQVVWEGYKEPEWHSASLITEDAPQVVQRYLAGRKSHKICNECRHFKRHCDGVHPDCNRYMITT